MGKTYSKAQKADQAAKALELHAGGLTERQIANQLGLTQPTVHRRLEYAVATFVTPQGEEALKLELARLDAVLAAMADKLSRGDTNAASVVVKTIALRAKLLGIEPAKVTLTEVAEGPLPPIVAALQARAAQQGQASE